MKNHAKHFTLIELLMITAQYCRNHVKVLYNRCGLLSSAGGALVRICTDKYGKVQRKAPQKPAFVVHHNACKASASCTDSALHICRRQMLHTFVCLTRRGVQDTKCFIRLAFTLIELLVNAACKTGVLYNRCGMLSLWDGALKTDKNGQKRISVRRRIRLIRNNIMLAKQALHAQTVRFIFAAGKCFIRRSRASFNQRSR